MSAIPFEQSARERKRILDALTELADSDDAEMAHREADAHLIEYLRLIDADDIAEAWEEVPKWYA